MMRLAMVGFAALVLTSGVAAAQNAADEEENLPAACAKLNAAARAEPAKVSTRMQLASCYERIGRTATAWREYQVVAKLANQAGDKEWQREMMAYERAKALEKRLVRLTISAPTLTAGAIIRRGSEIVPAAELGVPVPVDPGDIVVTATAEGFEPFTVSIKIAKEKLTTVEVPALKKAEKPTTPPATPTPPPQV